MSFYGEEIRKLMGQVLGLRTKTSAHDEDIQALKARVAELEKEQVKDKKVARAQGVELETNKKDLQNVKHLLAEIEKEREAEKRAFKSELHSAKTKEGIAKSKLEKMRRRH
jgi:hypothetical protein